jgi:hypothetical protein
MVVRVFLLLAFGLVPVFCQSTCEGVAAYLPCEFTFDLAASDAAAHPNLYQDVDIHLEFRSPHFRTFLMPAFWAGGRKFIVRFVPTEGGNWTYRITSNISSLEGQQGSFNAADSDAPGYVRVANVHHWATENKKPHLWMGCVIDDFGFLASAEFDRSLAAAEAAKFNHVQGSILGSLAQQNQAYSAADNPNLTYFHELDRRVMEAHKKRITTDLVLAADPGALAKLFPDWRSRKYFVRYVVGRYGALNVTWQLVEQFEGHPEARALLKEIGLALKEADAYQHPRSSNAKLTSSPLLGDGWMDFVIDHSQNDQIGAVEHQFYQVPFIGITSVQHIWNATMNGQYPEIEGKYGQEPKNWFDLMSDRRHWELEPYFDVDSARCVALDGVDYVVLVEKSGPIEVEVEKHSYDVSWLNPVSGELLEAKKYHGEHYTGQEPDSAHPWVLLIAREGREESMLKSWKFESRPVPVQDIELSVAKVPYQISEPTQDSIPQSVPVRFAAKLTRETRATRTMMYVWTGEVPADGLGFRVLGTGAQGTFAIPSDIATRYPAVISIRLNALNANGKAYSADKVYQLYK